MKWYWYLAAFIAGILIVVFIMRNKNAIKKPWTSIDTIEEQIGITTKSDAELMVH